LIQPYLRLVAALLVAIGLSACASPAEMQNMVVAQQSLVTAEVNSPFKNALVIASVSGGETTNPLWTSEVGGDAFQGALSASLEQNSLLSKTIPSSRFDLYAALGSVNQPLFGLDMTVSSTVNYRVVDRKSRQEWFNESVFASYTATFSDAAIGIQRLRLANEGSIRENIKEFIKRLVRTEPPAVLTPKVTKPDKPSAEELLRKLNKLLNDGLIDKKDFDRKKGEILKGI
jgi:hypothetical protein